MARVCLTDGCGKWFDPDRSLVFKESTRWDGRNHVSIPTGSQWDHERLHYTASGRWVLNHWSQWQGSSETYKFVTEEEAFTWMVLNDCDGDDDFEKLPEAVREAFANAEAAMEA